MLELLKDYFPFAVVATAIAGMILGATRWVDSTIHPDLRLSVALWLVGTQRPAGSPPGARDVFRGMFGTNMSWRRALITLVIMTLIAVAYYLYVFIHIKHTINIPMSTMPAERPEAIQTVVLAVAMGWPILWVCFAINDGVLDVILSRFSWGRVVLFVLVQIGLAGMAIGAAALVGGLLMAVMMMLGLPAWGEALAPAAMSYAAASTAYLWVGAALAVRGLVSLSRAQGGILRLVTKWISPERIEKEPIRLVGEFAAALVFVIVLAAGGVGPGKTPAEGAPAGAGP